MSASYIPFTFTSGTYRAKVKASYMDANNVTHTKDGKPYTFTVTRTIPPEPFDVTYVNGTERSSRSFVTFEVRWDYGYLLNSTYNRRQYTSISEVKYEGAIISSSSNCITRTDDVLETRVSLTYEPMTVTNETHYTAYSTKNGSARTPSIIDNSGTEFRQQITSVIYLANWSTTDSVTIPTNRESSYTQSRDVTKYVGYYDYQTLLSGIQFMTDTSVSYECVTDDNEGTQYIYTSPATT